MEDSLGSRIRRLRQTKFKGQKEVANLLGLSIPAYSKIETGNTDVNVTRLKQIAAVFGVTPEELLVGELAKHGLKAEHLKLKEQYGVLSDYCILLQRKLISTYEDLEKMRERVKAG